MYFALMGKLSARRQNLTADKDKGFTLIELLVVVIIIGILAAIAIPVYLGVQNNAKDSSVKSDVSNVKTAAVAQQTSAGSLPEAAEAANGGTWSAPWSSAGASAGANTKSIKYTKTGTTDFCVFAVSETNNAFYATSTKGVTAAPAGATSCPA